MFQDDTHPFLKSTDQFHTKTYDSSQVYIVIGGAVSNWS